MRQVDQIIVSTAIEHRDVSRSPHADKLVALPLAYDVEAAAVHSERGRFHPRRSQRLRLVMPARQQWSLKGQDLVFKGIAMLRPAEQARLEVLAFDWGIDSERSRELVRSLRLTDLVRFGPMLEKHDLWRVLGQPNVIVVDQLPPADVGPGGIGGVARDGMSVGTPVITYAEPNTQIVIFRSPPPLLHVQRTPEEIRDQIRKCLDLTLWELQEIGARGQAWLKEECDYRNVIPRYVSLHLEPGRPSGQPGHIPTGPRGHGAPG